MIAVRAGGARARIETRGDAPHGTSCEFYTTGVSAALAL